MTALPDRSRAHERSAIEIETQLLEADRRVGEAERVGAALRRRVSAAEARMAEARERVVRERAGRDEALTELTSRLDAERRRGTTLAESLQDQLADAELLLGEAQNALAEEREERTAAEEKFTAAAHARLAAALGERDGTEERLVAELEEREGDVRTLGTQLSEARTALEELKRERDEAAERLSAALAAHAAREDEHAKLGLAFESEQRAIREAIERVEAATLAARRQAEQGRAGVEEAQRRLAGELEAERLGRETAEAALERERSTRQHERDEAAGSLSSLRTDIETTIGALRERLEGEIVRARAVTDASAQRSVPPAVEDEPQESRSGRPDVADPSRPLPHRHRGLSEAAASVAAANAPAATADGNLDELNHRFDRIRAELAERGIRSARIPAGRKPGEPR